jgi:hypothetical protein
VQARVRDKRLGPQTLKEHGLRDSFRPSVEEKLQELEGLRGERRSAAMAKKHTPTGVEFAFSKDDTHGASR